MEHTQLQGATLMAVTYSITPNDTVLVYDADGEPSQHYVIALIGQFEKSNSDSLLLIMWGQRYLLRFDSEAQRDACYDALEAVIY